MTVAAPAVQFTLNDIDIGVRLVEALLAHVKLEPATIDYPALLAQARALHPRDAALGRAGVLGIGPKLSLVALFCLRHGYPNLAALAVHPVTGKAGPYAAVGTGEFAGVDWTLAPAQLVDDARTWRAAVPARLKPRAERPADVAWYAWFRSHRAECAQLTAEGKHEIINLIMAGLDPQAALVRVLAAQVDYGVAHIS